MSITISDVAKHAGLSVATVSKYLNHRPISQNSHDRIASAIAELNYQINDFARGLRTSTSMMIGLLVPGIDNIFTISLIKEVEQMLMGLNYSMILCDYDNNDAKLAQKIAFLRQKKVDGIIFLAGCTIADELKEEIRKMQEDGVALVFVNGGVDGMKADTVLVDSINAIYQSARLLITNGHEKIGMFSLSPNRWNTKEREEGYRRVFFDYHMQVEERLLCSEWKNDFDLSALRREAVSFIEANPDMTALILPGYQLTLAGIHAIHTLNRKIGEDIAVIGYDCGQVNEVLLQPLTFVRVPAEEMAKSAVEMMLSSLQNTAKEPRIIRTTAQLVEGQSIYSLS